MKKYLLILLTLILATVYCVAQTDSVKKQWPDSLLWKKANTFSLEAGGYIAPMYSKIICAKKSLKLSARGGFCFFEGNQHDQKNTLIYLVPVGLTAFWGKNENHFELGITELFVNEYQYPPGDITVHSETKNVSTFNTNLFIGYRYQKPTGCIFFKAGFHPQVLQIRHNIVTGPVQPIYILPNIALGYNFLSRKYRFRK